ncbi:MAG: hypothetical protein JSU07_03795 [Bacteroidetes bacterium]|nr:hypothetical protein [Bacteroidota bacterium]
MLTFSQTDKLFFKSGKLEKVTIQNINKHFVTYKASDSAKTLMHTDSKELLFIEKSNGYRHYFFSEKEHFLKDTNIKISNIISTRPLDIFGGRLLLEHEHYFASSKIGLVITGGITYDMLPGFGRRGRKRRGAMPQKNNASTRPNGIGFMAGIDLNFYIGKNSKKTFFIGPRLRYGIDKTILDVDAVTLQTQFGWRFGDMTKKGFLQFLSFGYGFVTVIDGQTRNLDRPIPWGSINYRVGFGW